jgi:ubiquinone/menaquinone biosynthesis C-methylase UbiE
MSHSQPAPANPANAPSARFFASIGITPGMRVLDVGCGNGDLSRTVAALAGPDGEVVGIDSSEAALTAARATPADAISAPLRYQFADLSTDLPDLGSFDAIVGRRVLMYLPDAAATLHRLARLAKRDTILGFQEHARADLPTGLAALPMHQRCYELMWRTIAAERGDVAIGYRLADLIRGAGFQIDHARCEGVLIQPWHESFLPMLMRIMLPRMVACGAIRADEIDVDELERGMDHERRSGSGTILWDLAFLVSGRLG